MELQILKLGLCCYVKGKDVEWIVIDKKLNDDLAKFRINDGLLKEDNRLDGLEWCIKGGQQVRWLR